ncbi:MAG: hypothetical protein NZ893_01465, partial [Candidatus Aenigmarchaeota archaeon]|nr:hypothetical protein [Candidatus Aenigmarchaeota archaeon]
MIYGDELLIENIYTTFLAKKFINSFNKKNLNFESSGGVAGPIIFEANHTGLSIFSRTPVTRVQ